MLRTFRNLSNYSKHFLIATCAILLSTFVFYPAFYTTTDEHDYIENAYLIMQGRLLKTDPECYQGASCGYFNGEGFISKYNLGLSFLLIPFVALHWRLTFFITVLAFIAGLWVFSKLLARRNIRSQFIYLYACFPAFVYYSRKTMTEIYTLSLIMLIYFLLFEWSGGGDRLRRFLSRYRYFLVGLLAGITVLIKYTNILFIAPILIYWGIIGLKNIYYTLDDANSSWQQLVVKTTWIILGALPFAIIFLYINHTFYGAPLRSGYYFSEEELLFIGSLVMPQTMKYLVILLATYPGLLFLGLFARYKHRYFIFGLLVLALIFFVGFPGYAFTSGILDFIFGVRFLIPILGLVLLIYSEALDRLLSLIKIKHLVPVGLTLATLLLIANMFAMSYLFKTRSDELAVKSNELYQTTSEGEVYLSVDIEERKLFNAAFKKGERWHLVK